MLGKTAFLHHTELKFNPELGGRSYLKQDGAARDYMDVFTASLRSACSLRRGHFVNNLEPVGFFVSIFSL
ncbi:hypothetical protein CQP30_03595 [Yersinia pestis]|uniref:Uncharacterized protein n=6 Tax=Yersinia pseudotuberculosis complex TaxID=1649845 RepID=A0A3G5L4G1_YERPE|nr:hypothetical [Yersinia pestis KIM10+]ABG12614.1 conserved hypothetical protein [Yersinia pestis Antiqua]ABG18952.1 conserved hypothetical protein [Yersinia pestis Nepal516]ADV99361.1 hypothetical protein YPC_2827 [Yersinia pestis biovar Medievalis str. Harbin 35]AYW81801.1 hypothetical protein EGX42_01705 [Yersinia pestis]AYW93803.1 hypothetical protein EGX47_22395 [Yersinia pseudotuberculosis]EEO81832.1 hypothetical protein YPF_1807 [Yersinia pestis biovar Orientalis str. India 195]EEO87